MILIDATGTKDDARFTRIEEGLTMLLEGRDTSASITRELGTGVHTFLFDELNKRGIKAGDIRAAQVTDHDAFYIAQSELVDYPVIVIDEAHMLDALPQVAGVIKSFEESGIKIIYVNYSTIQA